MNSFLNKLFTIIISFLLLSVKCHSTAALVEDSRLYFICDQEKGFFYLDLSMQFNVSNDAHWIDLRKNGNSNLTKYNFATSVSNRNLIYYIGGKATQPDDPFVYTFDVLNGNWNTPKIGMPPQQRVDFQAGIYKKTIYLFTRSENNAESDNFGRMIMLNTDSSNLAWTLGRNINPPLVRYGYTATSTNDGLIIYIGGAYQDGSYANMNEILEYDTKKNRWNQMNATGVIPKGRQMHSAVLSGFNTIIIYGGHYFNEDPSIPVLVLLDFTNLNYNYIQPSINIHLESRWGHASAYIKHQMIIAYGTGRAEFSGPNLLILSNPTKTTFNIASKFMPNIDDKMEITTGFILIAIFLAIAVLFVCFVKYKSVLLERWRLNRLNRSNRSNQTKKEIDHGFIHVADHVVHNSI